MKFTIVLVMVLMSLVSVSAFADISGKWLGQGEWTYEGSGTHCFMNLSFKESKTSLYRGNGYFDCDMVGLDIPEATFKRDGTKLIDENGTVVGSYIGNIILLKEAYDESVDVLTTITVDNLHFDYEEKWLDKEGREIYNITGRLFSNRELR